MALNPSLPLLTPDTSFFTCFGFDTASPLAHEWLGSKFGLVKISKIPFPKFKLLKVTFCPNLFNLLYIMFSVCSWRGTTHARLVFSEMTRPQKFILAVFYKIVNRES